MCRLRLALALNVSLLNVLLIFVLSGIDFAVNFLVLRAYQKTLGLRCVAAVFVALIRIYRSAPCVASTPGQAQSTATQQQVRQC